LRTGLKFGLLEITERTESENLPKAVGFLLALDASADTVLCFYLFVMIQTYRYLCSRNFTTGVKKESIIPLTTARATVLQNFAAA